MLDKTLLKFDETTHVYTYAGKKIPSVTRILRPISEKIYGDVPRYNMAKAASRGTDIHYAIELYNEFGVIEIDEEHRPYLDAYIEFKKSWNHEPEKSEYMVGSEMGYAGTLDNLGKIVSGRAVIDYKTTAKVYRDLVGLQLSAYRQALREEYIEVDTGMCLWLQKTGKYSAIFYDKKQLDNYFNDFQALLTAQKIIKFYGGKK